MCFIWHFFRVGIGLKWGNDSFSGQMTALPFSATPSPRPSHAIIDLLNLHEKNRRGTESWAGSWCVGSSSVSSLGRVGEGEFAVPQPTKPSGRSFRWLSLEGEVEFLLPVGCLLSLFSIGECSCSLGLPPHTAASLFWRLLWSGDGLALPGGSWGCPPSSRPAAGFLKTLRSLEDEKAPVTLRKVTEINIFWVFPLANIFFVHQNLTPL